MGEIISEILLKLAAEVGTFQNMSVVPSKFGGEK